MSTSFKITPVLVLTLILFIPFHLNAGELEDFKADVEKGRKSSQQSEHDESEPKGSSSWESRLISHIAGQIILFGGDYSMALASSSLGNDPQDIFLERPRTTGDIQVPFVRVDVTLGATQEGANNQGLRTELGYGAYAVQWDYYQFNESQPRENLKTSEILLNYRMSYGSGFEYGFGLGNYSLLDTPYESLALYLGAKYHSRSVFSRAFTLEWRFVSSDQIVDNEWSLLLPQELHSYKVGYRALTSDSERLSSLYLGASFHF